MRYGSWLLVALTSLLFATCIAKLIMESVHPWVGKFSWGVLLMARWLASGTAATNQGKASGVFFNRRRRFNGDVAALLPAFGIDMEEAGFFKLLNVLDIAWAEKYSAYEAGLLVAYSFAAGLYDHGLVQRADALVTDRLMPIQKDWIKKGIVRPELVDHWPERLEKRAVPAQSQASVR